VEGRSLLSGEARQGFVLEAAATSGTHAGNGLPLARPGYCGWRTQRYLFVRYGSGFTELYDYQKDPSELTNLGGSPMQRALRADLKAKAKDACSPVPPGFHW
jgi:hypothetical protein